MRAPFQGSVKGAARSIPRINQQQESSMTHRPRRPHSALAKALSARWLKSLDLRNQRGQSLVEFAFVSVMLLLLTATVIDFGRLFYTQITVENAARAGVLVAAKAPKSYSSVTCPSGPVPTTNRIGCAIAKSAIQANPADVTVDVHCEDLTFPGPVTVACPADPAPATRSRVTITTRFGFLMPVLTAFLGSSIPITASVTADQEALPPAATFIPTSPPGPTPTPTPAPTPTPTPGPTPTPTATPTPTPTPVPCVPGVSAPMPDLVEGKTPGSTETVAEARDEWLTAGFNPAYFTPNSGSNNKTVTNVTVDGPPPVAPDPGACYPISTTHVTVAHS
jgi:Flp pilus assembly protein TadG